MCNGNLRDLEDQVCGLFGSRQKSSKEISPTNNSIPSILWMDSQPREITSPTISTIPIPRMDMGFNKYDSSITKRQMSENPKGTENRKEKNLQKKNDICENSSNFSWDAFCYNKYQQFQVELYRPTRSKRKTKTSKRILSSPTKMEQENEEPNFELERINHNWNTFFHK
jgi:hypothetical protein